MTGFPWLSVLIAVPALGSLLVAALPASRTATPTADGAAAAKSAAAPEGASAESRKGAPSATPATDRLAKQLTLAITLLVAVLTLAMAFRFRPDGGPVFHPTDPTKSTPFQFAETYEWIPAFGVHYAVGVDGIALVLIALSAILMPVVVLASWNEAEGGKRSVKAYFALLLLLESMMIGVFAATDVFLFYVFFEAMLVPMYFLIGSYGGPQRSYAAVKFLLYSLLGGLLMLAAVIGLYVVSARGAGSGTFLFTELLYRQIDPTTAKWLFLGFFIAFAIKAPLWPFHTWLPDAAGQAPAGAAVLLVGVLDKVGTYGMLRFCLELFPSASTYFTPVVITLSVIGIIYGAVLAIGQVDIKRLIAYTSISHFGFIALGVFAMTTQGQSGATLYMVNHGFSTGALFLIAGYMISRRGSARIDAYGGVQKVAPLLAGSFLIAGLSGLALPGLSSFVSEFLVLVGTFTRYTVPAVIATVGIILAAVYILWMYQRTMNGPTAEAVADMPDLSIRERWAIGPVIAIIIALGFYPQPVLNVINPAVNETLKQVSRVDPPPAIAVTKGADE